MFSLHFLGNPESSSPTSVFEAWKLFKSELGNTIIWGGGINNKSKREQHLKKLPPLTNTKHTSKETEAFSLAKIITFSKRSRYVPGNILTWCITLRLSRLPVQDAIPGEFKVSICESSFKDKRYFLLIPERD